MSYCRTKCCARCAIKPGNRLLRFAALLKRKPPPKVITIGTMGNSVARSGQYATTFTFVNTMKKLFPKISWELDLSVVVGGFEPQHLYTALMASKPTENDTDKSISPSLVSPAPPPPRPSRSSGAGERNSGPEGLYERMLSWDVVIVQYLGFAAKGKSEPLLRERHSLG